MQLFSRSSALALAAVFAIAGCSGKDGSNGANGATGSNGTQGIPGPVTTTNESCMVCHATTRLSPTAANHAMAFPTTGAQANIAVSIASVANVGGKMAISFHVTANNAAGTAVPVTNIGATDIRAYFAEVSSGGTSNFLKRWLQGFERSGQFDFNGDGTNDTAYPFGSLNVSGAAAGDYVYTSAANIADAPTATNVQRIFLRASKTGMNTGNAIYNFLPAAVGTPVANSRDIVPSGSCNRCHYERIGDHGHGGGYNLSEACVVCHSPLLDESFYTSAPHNMQALAFDMPTMIHQIHGAIAVVNDWSKVTYPAKLNDCKVCHTGGAQSDNYKNNPNALACTSCHTFVKFSDSAGYSASLAVCGDPAWVYPNACKHRGTVTPASTVDCTGCHDPAAVDGYHDATYNRTHPTGTQVMNNVPEFNVNMAIAAPAAGTFYVPGTDTLSITVTLTNKSDGSAVPATFYTSAKHATGTTSTTALSSARLYVYGPRTAPKPVLTAAAAVTPVPTQSTQLFASPTPTDTHVVTTASGFKYTVAIPAGFPAGTYFVRFYATNYGYVSDTNYVTDSNAFATIQIGNATVQPKVSGDACNDCHGDHLASFHDARHSVKFDTDECISCHDLSGNHADPLSNRVHAIHSASTTGDILAIDWAEVEYPVTVTSDRTTGLPIPGTGSGGVKRCKVCHTSTSTQYNTNVGEVACMGCHADNVGAVDHFRQNGGQY